MLRLRGRFRGRRGLVAFLAVMGPGLIAGIAGNDAGGITTYSVMGATTGLTLLWIFPITIAILAIVQEMAARLGVVTGQGLSDLIRDRFGVRPTAFAMIVLLIANVANTVAEFSGRGGRARDLRDLALPRRADRRGRHLGAGHQGQLPDRRARLPVGHRRVLRLHRRRRSWPIPTGAQVGRALVTPSLDLAPAELLLLVAVVGTTITPYMQFYLTSAVAEKGIGVDELGLEQADAVGGSIWTNVIAIFIVVAAATTIGVGGRHDHLGGRRRARRSSRSPGKLAEALFAVGLFGASVLAATIMPLSTAFVICEAFGWESGVDKRFGDARAFFSIYTFVLVAGALVVLHPGARPAAGDHRLAEPPGPAAAGRARVHGPAGQRPAADGRPSQRSDRQRAGLVGGRAGDRRSTWSCSASRRSGCSGSTSAEAGAADAG